MYNFYNYKEYVEIEFHKKNKKKIKDKNKINLGCYIKKN